MQSPPISSSFKLTPDHIFRLYGFRKLGDDSGVILVGSDKTSMFSLAGNAERLLGEGKKITIFSRGLYNPRALDLCNILVTNGAAVLEKLNTKTVFDEEARRRVSSLEIQLKPAGSKK
jgi:hypothetical protein